ncbi:hypothetical protein ACFWF7_30515 [Nocardia sp. NPDC060256]|uniref:hypothetical protein n=1 Tax=unclassified Nocardia TaxID=2637762 RepID=UPI00364F9C21
MDHEVVEQALAALVASGSRQLDRDCDLYARRYIAEGVEPQFDVSSTDFDSDPYLICADRYWNYRLTNEPTLQIAVECAGWLREHVAPGCRTAIREKWALGYAFITRDSVESLDEVADATRDIVANDDQECSRAYFATLYHAGKLRANFCFDELNQFLESSPLSMAAGSHRETTLFVALQAFAAFGSRRITEEFARSLLDRAWSAPERTYAATDIALNGLAVGVPFDDQGELLSTHATEALADYPDSHLFHYRLATGQYLSGAHDAALNSIDTALRLLPAIGWRVSHELFQGQYLTKREAILNGRTEAQRAAADRARVQRHEHSIAGMTDTVRNSMLRTIEVVSIFAAVIAFAVGSLNVSLNGNLRLSERLWIVTVLGAGLLLFALLIIGGSWLIARRLSGERSD